MSIQHSYYKGLCALAASGQIAHEELATLREHMQTCEDCRRDRIDFRFLSSQLVANYAIKHSRVEASSRMTTRFIARARTQGIPLKYCERKQTRWIALPSFRLFAELIGTGLLATLSSHYLMTHWRIRYRPDNKGAIPSSESSQASAVGSSNVTKQRDALKDRLSAAEGQLAVKEAALESTRAAVQRLEVRSAELEQADLKLQQELAARDTEIADLSTRRDQLKSDVENLRAAKATQDLLFHADRSEVEDLRLKIASLTEELNEREELSAAAEQAKDLIVARKLHIVDVHDHAAGNRPRPFGRIFYTEGKRLIFYAYDLGDKSTKVTFYVWGEKSGVTQAKILGVLHADDMRDGRWVVSFDDPQTLAQINTVFVTAESRKKQPEKPSNNRLLVAYIDGTPNHP